MERRTFIHNSVASTCILTLVGLGLNSCMATPKKHITILQTNDVHSHIDAFPQDHADFLGLGGLARRAGLVQHIRTKNPNTLLFDAGDIFQGTPYFNFYGGELEFKLMSMLNYDAATIGKHDFDSGIDGLLAQMPYAKFNFIASNYDFSKTAMDGYTQTYKIYLRDGCFGVNLGRIDFYFDAVGNSATGYKIKV